MFGDIEPLSSRINYAVNPFATRYVEPGKVGWFASQQPSIDQLARRFQSERMRQGAIVGPHGSGKSTLLEHLLPRLGTTVYREAAGVAAPSHSRRIQQKTLPPISAPTIAAAVSNAGQPIVLLSLRRDKGCLQRIWHSRSYWKAGGLLVIDGFEQLGMLGRWITIQVTRQQQVGLLVTCHHPVALPTLIETSTSVPLVRHIIEQAFANAGLVVDSQYLSFPLLQRLLDEEQGNAREVLMRLYDIAHKAQHSSLRSGLSSQENKSNY